MAMDKETTMIIIIAVACIVVLTIIFVFIGVACMVYKRRKDEPEKPNAMASVDEVDDVVRTETGKYEHSITTNPAFGKEDILEGEDMSKFDDKPIDLAMEFGDDFEFEEGREASETGSNYSFTPEDIDDTTDQQTGTKISILNDNTWGGVNGKRNDADFDFNMFNPLRGVQSRSDGNVHKASSTMGQHAVDIYEAGQALKIDVPPSTNPCNYTNTGSRLLWQKKRFKNF